MYCEQTEDVVLGCETRTDSHQFCFESAEQSSVSLMFVFSRPPSLTFVAFVVALDESHFTW